MPEESVLTEKLNEKQSEVKFTEEELTQVNMGRIVKEKYPDLDENDLEAVRRRAIAAINVIQKAKAAINDPQ